MRRAVHGVAGTRQPGAGGGDVTMNAAVPDRFVRMPGDGAV